MQMQMREVKIDLFQSQIFVFWNCKPIEVNQYITKNMRGLKDHVPQWFKDNNNAPPKGVCVSEYGVSANCIIWLSQSPTKNPGLLAHEVTHATHRITQHWTIPLDENTQEIFSMLTGYIIEKVTLKK